MWFRFRGVGRGDFFALPLWPSRGSCYAWWKRNSQATALEGIGIVARASPLGWFFRAWFGPAPGGGSQKAPGGPWLTLFFAALFFVGWCFFLVVLTMFALPEWRVNQRFVPTRCTVLAKRLATQFAGGEPAYRPEILISYTVQGTTYSCWTYDITQAYWAEKEEVLAVLRRYRRHQQYRCWYDPADPRRAVLVRGFSGYVWLLLLLPSGLILVGGVGLAARLVSWRISAERRAALMQQAARSLPRLQNGSEPPPPCLPKDRKYTDSPGARLAYRLPLQNTTTWKVVAFGLGCLVWNGMATVFGTMAVNHLWRGHWDLWLLGAALVSLAVGLRMLLACLRQIGRLAVLGQTVIEVSDHPFRPGREYRLWVAQLGRLRLRVFRVLLVCYEVAVFRQGTDERTEVQLVFARELLRLQDVTVTAAEPLEAELSVTVPPGAMHSFRAEHGEIRWEVVVQGVPGLWPEFRREFPVLVYPPAPVPSAPPAPDAQPQEVIDPWTAR